MTRTRAVQQRRTMLTAQLYKLLRLNHFLVVRSMLRLLLTETHARLFSTRSSMPARDAEPAHGDRDVPGSDLREVRRS
jgi:hypothetical protein